MNFSTISNAANDKFVLSRGLQVFKATWTSPLFFATEEIAKTFIKEYGEVSNMKGYQALEVGTEKANRAMLASFGCKKPKLKKGTNLKRFTDGMEKLGLHVTFA